MKMLSVTQYAKLHGLSAVRVRVLAKEGRLNAEKIGEQWVIPADTPKPEDKRVKSGKYKDWRKKEDVQ